MVYISKNKIKKKSIYTMNTILYDSYQILVYIACRMFCLLCFFVSVTIKITSLLTSRRKNKKYRVLFHAFSTDEKE